MIVANRPNGGSSDRNYTCYISGRKRYFEAHRTSLSIKANRASFGINSICPAITLIAFIMSLSVCSQKPGQVSFSRSPDIIHHLRILPRGNSKNISAFTYRKADRVANETEILKSDESRGSKVRTEHATGALLNNVEDDIEDDEIEEFYHKDPLDDEKGSSEEDDDYLQLADVELEIESEKPKKSGRPKTRNRKPMEDKKYGSKVVASKTRKRSRGASNGTDKVTAQQQTVAELRLVDEADCAFILQRGESECVTYADIDHAIERAKIRLNFDSFEFDDSTELSEAKINSVGELLELTTRLLADKFELTWDEIALELEQVEMRRTIMWEHCPRAYKSSPSCNKLSRYRTHSGHCNNLAMGSHLGASNTPFQRHLPPDYADRIGTPRTGGSSELPPARLIALELHPDLDISSPDHSALFMAWGQLLNHDLAMASNARDGTGHSGSCCDKSAASGTCFPIEIAADDPLYSRHGIKCHEFKRSLAAIKPGCKLGVRSQFNTVTSYVDASFVYGSTKSGASMLRAKRGLLRVWDYFRGHELKPLLPPQLEDPDEECVGRTAGRYCFLSGDLRTNQQIQLVALHTIHTRQHNRLASALSRLNPHWTDNKIYHEARHIHIALVQHILITEYLPALLGASLMAEYNLIESARGSRWDHYQPDVDGSIAYGFAAAAFRQGHSTVASQVFRYNNLHELTRTYQLRHLYRQPWALFEPGAMDEFLLGTLDAPAQALDPFVSSDLSGHLLQMPDTRVGLDLVAINIQRGRDQGLPGYNAYREWCNLGRLKRFRDLRGHMRSLSVQIMSSLYETVDDIDLFTGGISELPLDGAQVGPTFACIIGRQFGSLRAGDRFWFEGSKGLQAFSLAQLDSIKQVSLARLICANSDEILTIQQRALHLAHPILNPRKSCDRLADLDLTLWRVSNEDERR